MYVRARAKSGMSVSFTRTLLLGSDGSGRTANFIPAPIHVSGGLPTMAFSKSPFHGSGGNDRTREKPSSFPTWANTAPPWGVGVGLLAATNVPDGSTVPSRFPALVGPVGAGGGGGAGAAPRAPAPGAAPRAAA